MGYRPLIKCLKKKLYEIEKMLVTKGQERPTSDTDVKTKKNPTKMFTSIELNLGTLPVRSDTLISDLSWHLLVRRYVFCSRITLLLDFRFFL